jgi:hypothetical protein
VDQDPAILEGLRRLRTFHTALILIEEVYVPRGYVLDNSSGRPVMPLPGAWEAARKSGRMDPADPFPMYVPEDTPDCLQLLVIPELLDVRTDPAADRYMAYHGKPVEAALAALTIDTAKWPSEVCDGDQIMVRNALAADEPRLCKKLNADPARLALLCERAVGTRPEAPVAVGIDPGGLDVRARFGIIRVEFTTPAADAVGAMERIESLITPA